MKLTRRPFLGLLSALGLAGCSAADQPSRSPETSSTAAGVPQPVQIRYGDHPSQFAELTLPVGGDQLPVVVIVHGGFWRTAYGLELGRPLATDLLTHGWATLNVEYRRVGTDRTSGGGGWPQTGADVAAAVDTLKAQGQQLANGRLELGRVVALGHSAGGQLAGWLAARTGSAPGTAGAEPQVSLAGFVSQAGVLDLVGAANEHLGGSAVTELMGGSPAQLGAAYGSASPLALVPLGVPSVCIHGGSDANVPLSQSERFVAAARAAGDDAELHRFDGDHFAPITVGSEAWTLCVAALTRLLQQ